MTTTNTDGSQNTQNQVISATENIETTPENTDVTPENTDVTPENAETRMTSQEPKKYTNATVVSFDVPGAEAPQTEADSHNNMAKTPVLREKEIQRQLKTMGIANIILIALIALSILGSIASVTAAIYTGLATNTIILIIILCTAILLAELCLKGYAVFDPKKIYKPKLVQPFLEVNLKAKDYEWKQTYLAKADIKDAQIAGNLWLNAQASDRFKATYRGCKFDFYDLVLSHFSHEKIARDASYDKMAFMGQLFILPLQFSLKCPIRITEYSAKEKADPQRTVSLIKTGCLEFDNRFLVDVLVDEQAENTSQMNPQEAMAYAREILTPELAQAFVDADDKADSRTRMYLNGNKLYLTHENEFDPFEYNYTKDKKCSLNDLKSRIKSEIARIQKILDALIDHKNLIHLVDDLHLNEIGYIEDAWQALEIEDSTDQDKADGDVSNVGSEESDVENSNNENNVTENSNNENNVTEKPDNEIRIAENATDDAKDSSVDSSQTSEDGVTEKASDLSQDVEMAQTEATDEAATNAVATETSHSEIHESKKDKVMD